MGVLAWFIERSLLFRAKLMSNWWGQAVRQKTDAVDEWEASSLAVRPVGCRSSNPGGRGPASSLPAVRVWSWRIEAGTGPASSVKETHWRK